MSAELPGRAWTPEALARLFPDGLGLRAARRHLTYLETEIAAQERRRVDAARRSHAEGQYETSVLAKLLRARDETRNYIQRESAGNP